MSPRTRRRAPEAVLAASARLTPKLLSVLPARAKRLMAGGRAMVVDGNTLDPTLQAFCAGLRTMGVTGLVADDDTALSRRLMRSTCLALGGEPLPLDVTDLSCPGPAGPIRLRRYRAGLPDAPALVYCHGGGWVLGDLDSYDALCRRLCVEAGVHVFSVDYRLAPEHPAPAALDDCLAAFRWVAAHADELDVPADRIGIGGDSAGGNLAAAVAQLTRGDTHPPAMQLLIYPVTDIRTPTRSRTLFAEGLVLTEYDIGWFGDQYLNGSEVPADDPRVSPARADDLSGLPPALVVTAGFDPLRDEGNAYAAALVSAGVPVDLREARDMTHGYVNFHALGGAVAANISELSSALRAHLRSG